MSHQTWGGRFDDSLDQEFNAFQASLSFDHLLYEQDILGSMVHASMLARVGLITRADAASILRGLKAIKHELANKQIELDIQAEDIHMFIENLLYQKIGEPAKKLHTGRSRNDQVALDLRLYVRKSVDQISVLMTALNDVFNELSQNHQENWMPGYTHLQQAQPIRLGEYFSAYQAMFKRDLGRLYDLRKRLNQCPLGAGALAGSNLPLDRHWVAAQLGFDGIVENTLDAVSDRDFIIEFLAFASILMMHLSRLAEDMVVFATAEFDFVTLSDAFSTGSSLMPNKKNPDVFELMRGKSGRVLGHLMAMLTVMKGLPLSYNKDMQEDKEGLFDTVKTLQTCLHLLPRILKNLNWNLEKMDAQAKSGFLDATRYLEELVLKGIPFREAHHLVGKWVKEAIVKNISLAEVKQKF